MKEKKKPLEVLNMKDGWDLHQSISVQLKLILLFLLDKTKMVKMKNTKSMLFLVTNTEEMMMEKIVLMMMKLIWTLFSEKMKLTVKKNKLEKKFQHPMLFISDSQKIIFIMLKMMFLWLF